MTLDAELLSLAANVRDRAPRMRSHALLVALSGIDGSGKSMLAAQLAARIEALGLRVAQIGIDCRYCHTTVETAACAGIPPTETCMNCHSQIWADSPTLEPVRESYRNNTPIEWSRVHDLPDFVYFDHSVHVSKGVACVSCHGRVDKMPLMFKAHTLQMQWCIACHKNPDAAIRPRSVVTRMDWPAPEGFEETHTAVVAEYHVQSLIDCSTCHRGPVALIATSASGSLPAKIWSSSARDRQYSRNVSMYMRAASS